MKLYAIYTDSHNVLKDKWFLKTMKDDWDLNINYIGCSGARHSTRNFFNIVAIKKLELIVKSIKENINDIIVWSDVDIQFFGKCENAILESLKDKDIVFQRKWLCRDEVNVGFHAMKCNERTLRLWEYVLRYCRKNICDFGNERFPLGEQDVVNRILHDDILDIKWGILPDSIWAKSCGLEPPIDILLHHANCVGKINRKLKQLEEIRNLVSSPYRLKLAYRKRRMKKFIKGMFPIKL